MGSIYKRGSSIFVKEKARVDKIDFGRLKLELTRLSRQESNWGDKMVTTGQLLWGLC